MRSRHPPTAIYLPIQYTQQAVVLSKVLVVPIMEVGLLIEGWCEREPVAVNGQASDVRLMVTEERDAGTNDSLKCT